MLHFYAANIMKVDNTVEIVLTFLCAMYEL